MSILITRPDGTTRVYNAAMRYENDGYGDYILFDKDNNQIASRKRGSVEEIEVTSAGEN